MLVKDILRTYRVLEGSVLHKMIGCIIAPGVHAVIVLRFGQWIKWKPLWLRFFLEPVYMFFHYLIRLVWGIEIARSAEIGEGFYIGHSGGIIVAKRVRIGKNASISQQVSIGGSGQGDQYGVPVIGDNVYIAPGARLFGKIHVGNNVKIGANAVIYKDVPDNAVVVLDPGFKIISFAGNQPKH